MWFCNYCLLQQTHPHELFQKICGQANRAITKKTKNQVFIYIYVHIYIYIYICVCVCVYGARGGIVVKALSYKPSGRGFDSRWYHWNFSVTIFPAALGPWGRLSL
jgi:hypothetical protein